MKKNKENLILDFKSKLVQFNLENNHDCAHNLSGKGLKEIMEACKEFNILDKSISFYQFKKIMIELLKTEDFQIIKGWWLNPNKKFLFVDFNFCENFNNSVENRRKND